MVILIVSMGIIIKILLQMYLIMGDENVNMWHNRLDVHCTLVTT